MNGDMQLGQASEILTSHGSSANGTSAKCRDVRYTAALGG